MMKKMGGAGPSTPPQSGWLRRANCFKRAIDDIHQGRSQPAKAKQPCGCMRASPAGMMPFFFPLP